MRRLFLAVRPAPSWCAPLSEAAAAFEFAGARPVPAVDWHVTLCFLGAVDEARLAPLCRSCEQIIADAFVLTFDRLEYWRRPRALVAATVPPPPVATVLVRQLEAAASALGLALDPRPWRPHLTLVRSVPARHFPNELRSAQPLLDPLPLTAERFYLVESRRAEGRRYQSLASWPLKRP